MPSSMVSIRIPALLLGEFKSVSKKDHFLDLSEAVRSIVRKNWMNEKYPASHQIKEIRKQISQNIRSKSQADLINELKKIRDSLITKND